MTTKEHLKKFWMRWTFVLTMLAAIPATVASVNAIAEYTPWVTKATAGGLQKQWKRSTDEIILNLKALTTSVGKNSEQIKGIKFRNTEEAYDRSCDKVAEMREEVGRVPQYLIKQLDRRYRGVLKFDRQFPRCATHEK